MCLFFFFFLHWQLIDQGNVKTESKTWHFSTTKFNNPFLWYFPELGNTNMEWRWRTETEIWQWSITNPQEGLSFTKIHLLFYICSHSKQSHLRNKIDTNTLATHYESENSSEPRQMCSKSLRLAILRAVVLYRLFKIISFLMADKSETPLHSTS